MQASPAQFEGLITSITQSQDVEAILGKQPIFSEYGSQVRAILSALPPEVSRDLTSGYREPVPHLLGQVEAAIMTRELAIENAAQQVNLDKAWVSGEGNGRRIAEQEIGAEDSWNMDDPM